ncbi:hypothetical protein HNQ50_002120 [Silvimonas terrae]|uniref:Uncharacterized protein n=1 Tax=Silvimonas terrae TaxID=300266 RepID=A0A840RG46_9NEIS|nr:hypothetical protein [Silvimonas terrae]
MGFGGDAKSASIRSPDGAKRESGVAIGSSTVTPDSRPVAFIRATGWLGYT